MSTSPVGRLAVAELVTFASIDARPHRHGGVECFCAGSVVRQMLAPGRCPSCPWDRECVLPRLRKAGVFSRPVCVQGRTLLNGHHRLVVAFEQGEEFLPVSDDPDSQYRLSSAEDVEWVAAEIRGVVRDWPGEEFEMLLELVESELGYRVTGAGAVRAVRGLLT